MQTAAVETKPSYRRKLLINLRLNCEFLWDIRAPLMKKGLDPVLWASGGNVFEFFSR